MPIVPGAILFDLRNGGDKDWRDNPYPRLGAVAFLGAAKTFDLGSAGAGLGALTRGLKGGLGSASCVLDNGLTVGALVAVNALGSAVAGEGPHFWAAPYEMGAEFGGLGHGRPDLSAWEPAPSKLPGEATTIAIVATDADLTQAEAHRMAVAAHDGIARALVPSHTLLDGDLVFAAATGARPLADPVADLFGLGHAASACLARAIARADIYWPAPRRVTSCPHGGKNSPPDPTPLIFSPKTPFGRASEGEALQANGPVDHCRAERTARGRAGRKTFSLPPYPSKAAISALSASSNPSTTSK